MTEVTKSLIGCEIPLESGLFVVMLKYDPLIVLLA